jgi:hypothetical protein
LDQQKLFLQAAHFWDIFEIKHIQSLFHHEIKPSELFKVKDSQKSTICKTRISPKIAHFLI